MFSKAPQKIGHETCLGHVYNVVKTCPRHLHMSCALNRDIIYILGHTEGMSWHVLLDEHKIPYLAYKLVPCGHSETLLEAKI